jgi:hypothetical protein
MVFKDSFEDMIINYYNDKLDEYCYKAIMERCPEVKEIWYWYQDDCYDGRGTMILNMGNEYYYHDMGHCSCYGPIDYIHEFNEIDENQWSFLLKDAKELTTYNESYTDMLNDLKEYFLKTNFKFQ